MTINKITCVQEIKEEINNELVDWFAEDTNKDEPEKFLVPELVINRAAYIITGANANNYKYDYAFGHDGSIGLHIDGHCDESNFALYYDFLPDGRVRTSEKIIIANIISSEKALEIFDNAN